MNRIALLTSNHRRHRWVAARLAEVAELICVVAESKSLQNPDKSSVVAIEKQGHFEARDRAEDRWFHDAPACYAQISENVLELSWQEANSQDTFELLRNARLDRVFLFGSCIIREPVLSFFQGRIVNMHLGLSPYYRGSATNYWPLADALPECVGVTVHHATATLDGGRILGQVRPDMKADDSVHDVGCKTIMAGATLLQYFAQMPGSLPVGVLQEGQGKICRRADFSVDSLHQVMSLMKDGMLKAYLADKTKRDARYPIVEATRCT